MTTYGYGDRWWAYEPAYTTPTAQQLTIPWISVQITSPTRAVITLATPSVTPGSYGGSAASTGSFSDPDFTFTTTSGYHVRENLIPGQRYTVRARAYSGANATGTYGEYIYESFTMPKAASVASVSSTVSGTTTPSTVTYQDAVTKTSLEKILAEEYKKALEESNGVGLSNQVDDDQASSFAVEEKTGVSYAASGNRELSKSYLKIDQKSKEPNSYSIAIKDSGISTSYKKYTFGTGILFASTADAPTSGGGMGFFTNSTGTSGYFVELKTDQSNKDLKDKSLKIFKVVNSKRIYLTDSQDTESGRLLGGVLSSTLYKLDIDVTIEDGITVIDVYVNNFKVSAADKNEVGTTDPRRNVIAPTSNIALFSILNKTAFDYVYANPINSNQTIDAASRRIYDGQYATATLDFAFGEKIAEDFNSSSTKLSYIEEFGKTVRELRYVKANFTQSAAIPLYASVGVNKFAKVIGSKFSNHGAEMFVINNAGAFIPLAYGNEQQFFVVGNYVDTGSQHEYTEPFNESTPVEPATFQSMWIQSEQDAKALYGWIKNQWSKQQQSITMDIFGNPFIEVGDVITVNYLKNDLNGTQKFLVTNVNLGFEGGLSTSITARSIYS
jgi:hypothetical protein